MSPLAFCDFQVLRFARDQQAFVPAWAGCSNGAAWLAPFGFHVLSHRGGWVMLVRNAHE